MAVTEVVAQWAYFLLIPKKQLLDVNAFVIGCYRLEHVSSLV